MYGTMFVDSVTWSGAAWSKHCPIRSKRMFRSTQHDGRATLTEPSCPARALLSYCLHYGKMIRLHRTYFWNTMHPTIRRCFVQLALILSWLVVPVATQNVVAQAARPNILLIISDDQRYDSMNYMPRTKSRIFDQGVKFANAYATTPLCCPSRASILTGMYAHNHNVRDNNAPLAAPTFMQYLHDNGYYTGIVGKYLGYWNGNPRPEYDYWATFQGTTAPYFDPVLNINGTEGVAKGYITHRLRGYSLDFLTRAHRQSKPFALIVTPNAPHEPADPAPEDANLYPNLAPYRPPSYNEADVSDKSSFLQSQPLLTADVSAQYDDLRRKQLQTLNAVDTLVNQLLNQLQAQGKLDTTLVIYMSDNGMMYGEHRRGGKKTPTRNPFGFRSRCGTRRW